MRGAFDSAQREAVLDSGVERLKVFAYSRAGTEAFLRSADEGTRDVPTAQLVPSDGIRHLGGRGPVEPHPIKASSLA